MSIQAQPGQQPPPAYAPNGVKTAIQDPQALAALNAVRNYELRAATATAQAAANACFPNVYVLGDADRQYTIPGYTNPACCSSNKVDTVGMPVFIIEEESSCCCRCCCSGMQPLYAKVYNANGPPIAGETKCNCIYMGHTYPKQEGVPPFMTFERDGCNLARKWLGCFVCNMCCAEDMYVHRGDPSVAGKPGSVGPKVGGHFARVLQPKGGGGCSPVANIFQIDDSGTEQQVAVMEGPCALKGCMELCFDTNFTFSSQRGRQADFGVVNRPKPEDCYNCCRMMYTNNDFYTVNYSDDYLKMNPDGKAAMLASLIQLEYQFFEDDTPPCFMESRGNGVYAEITLCYKYCYGCQIPIKCCCYMQGQQ
eukprot:m.58821 g.58821  ORF g.58821 m.58821 type:complete len:365 (+) comp22616_c0_seq1:212-1306(+)